MADIDRLIGSEHQGIDREMLVCFYTAALSEGGTVDEINLRAIRAVLARWGAADGKVIEGQLISGWHLIDTAPQDGTEILASDYDAIEIVRWDKGCFKHNTPGRWLNRESEIIDPSWWQPLPEHPSLPEVDDD